MARGVTLLAAAAAAAAVAAQVIPPTPQMQQDAAAIIAAANATTSAWDQLAYLTDTYGPRMSGSPGLNAALQWIAGQAATVDGLKVTLQPVTVPHWVRGTEWAVLESPRQKALHYVGLGYSNATVGPDGSFRPITAEVLVVGSQAELQNRSAEAQGKIVLFDWQTWEGELLLRLLPAPPAMRPARLRRLAAGPYAPRPVARAPAAPAHPVHPRQATARRSSTV